MFIVYKPLRMKNVEVSNEQSRGNQETRTKQLPKKTEFIRRRFIKIKCS